MASSRQCRCLAATASFFGVRAEVQTEATDGNRRASVSWGSGVRANQSDERHGSSGVNAQEDGLTPDYRAPVILEAARRMHFSSAEGRRRRS